MSIGPVAKETTYKYSIDGDILTLTIEQRDGRNNLNTIISAKFKKCLMQRARVIPLLLEIFSRSFFSAKIKSLRSIKNTSVPLVRLNSLSSPH